MTIDLAKVEATLLAAAEAAAAHTLPLFRTTLAVDNKYTLGFDPVTEADRGAETVIRAVIAEAFPDHAIIGEEWGNSGDSDYTWIIDPVDGTRAFISGAPVWGTLIGFAHSGVAIAGLMSQPFIGETFLAVPGRSTYRRGGLTTPNRTSGQTELAPCRVFTTTPSLFRTPEMMSKWTAIESATRLQRFGMDCYGYALLAAGHADLVIEPFLNTYDIAALVPIIREAGGAIACWDGSDPTIGGNVVAAATPELLEKALELVNAS
ncbi:histidinol-phosphatase [Devosia psychrophila]|uniref:Histidinol-phosphatase n=1 Tax=Devosia psychrophila TaxID=728005 RepID=A0A0F5Q2E3_9HYPH|nr:histidinol-phosphatase [Devosia psychrophila]KKC34254.1 inositol monophosphatase [Devosia psychrophila]SFC70181.1 histidinol-phosphatase, inositol monophosphatase family [Devosia psychrophila]